MTEIGPTTFTMNKLLSGGGWRTNVLAALDDRIRASVSVGWMTTGDYQRVYYFDGAIGTSCLLPGVTGWTSVTSVVLPLFR